MKIRVGSRDSRLAVIQAEMVMDCIRRHHPELEVELVTMKTTGDKILDRTLDQIGGKGLFVKELDRALLDGEVHITVHSFKDMPMEQDPRLPIVAVSAREIPFDALILPSGRRQIGSVEAHRLCQPAETNPVGDAVSRHCHPARARQCADKAGKA